jgi:hypothetical protein
MRIRGRDAGEIAPGVARVSPEVRFWGVYPLCFLKSAERLKNVWVRRGWEMSVCKRLKMNWLLGR